MKNEKNKKHNNNNNNNKGTSVELQGGKKN